MSSKEKSALAERLQEPEAPVAERLRAFALLGISNSQLRDALMVSPESLRLWMKEDAVSVRRANRVAIDNIAKVAAILLGRLSEVEALRWLTEPVPPASDAPLDLIRRQPGAILAAAKAHASGSEEEARALLRSAQGPDVQSAPALSLGATDRSLTQVKKNLLARLSESAAGNASANEVVKQLGPEDGLEYKSNPNYDSYEALVERIRRKLLKAGDQPAQRVISGLLSEESAGEETLRKSFEISGGKLIGTGSKKILVYALSMRVIHALWGVDESIQKTCELYVAEGRVKGISPAGELSPYADAAETLHFLEHTKYERFIVPDAVAAHMVAEHEVDLVMLGAQVIFEDKRGQYTHIVNSVGTAALLRAAMWKPGVQVAIFAEETKVSRQKPRTVPSSQVVPVRLPPTEEGGEQGHGRLRTISSELCDVRLHEGDEGAKPIFTLHSASGNGDA